MDHAITVRDLVWPALAIGGVVLVGGAVFVVLSIFASAFKD